MEIRVAGPGATDPHEHLTRPHVGLCDVSELRLVLPLGELQGALEMLG